MPFKRTSTCAAIGLLISLLAATPSFGQGPLGFQIFAPADLSTYGGDIEPNEGYFFQFDGLYWSISGPKIKPIGDQGPHPAVFYGPTDKDSRTQTNTLDNSCITDQFSAGNRIEFGRVENRNGWFVSIYQQRDMTQDNLFQSADITFRDPGTGVLTQPYLYGNVNNNSATTPVPYSPEVLKNLPTTFYDVFVENAIDTWGVEANYLHRFLTCHNGGTFELFLGARYYEFNDNFRVHTANDDGSHIVPSFLGGSYWDTEAGNHVVGPQIGLRWFKKEGRWMFSTEGRFFAGINCQNVSQQVSMGPNLNPGQVSTSSGSYYPPFQPVSMSATTATHFEYATEFSPAIELRLEARYQITRALSFHAGWTGMWIDNIARASDVIDYVVPAMGINMDDNKQGVFVNGLTLGFDVNR